jgi:iron uptake system component EfeO
MHQASLRVGVFALLALAAPALAACGSSDHKGGGRDVAVTLNDSGCSPEQIKVPAGPVSFEISNEGTTRVSEMELKNQDGVILGEAENVVEGVPGSFSLNLDPGTYVVSCPNGEEEDQGSLEATGKATGKPSGASAALLGKATAGYKGYVEEEVTQLLAGTREFVAALRAGDTAKAKDLYGPTRIHYEAVEPVAESFGDLDPEIDARVNDVASEDEWTGFHRIERTLWERNTTKGTEAYGKKLLEDVETLQRKVKALDLQAAQLANGAVELLNEVSNSKITGEEDRYSHTDLSDFQGNLAGSRKAFELLIPALKETGNAKLVAEIEGRFEEVQKGLDAYKRDTPLGFALYEELTPQDKRQLAVQVDTLAEPLSTVAATVSGA